MTSRHEGITRTAMWSQFIAFVYTSALLSSGANAAKPLEDRDWIEVTTPHFTIRSTLREKKVLEMARHAELLRAAILLITNSESADSSVATIFYALPGRSYDTFAARDNTSGMFLPGVPQNYGLVRDSSRINESSVIKHEFVHDLMRGHSGFDYPKWYVEGLAEYFEGSDLHGDYFRVGLPMDNHIRRLLGKPWVSADELLTSSHFKELGRNDFYSFYSQSWALVHYLNHAGDKPASLKDGFERYAAERALGTSELDSFIAAFEIEPDEIRNTLRRYLRRECCTVLKLYANQLLPELKPSITELSRASVSLGLGQVASRLGESDLAQHWFDVAKTDSLTRAPALAFSAQLAAADNDAELASQLLDEAVSLAPDDPQVHTEQASFLIWQAENTPAADERSTLIGEAQKSLVRAWRLDKELAQVYFLTGKTYLMLNEDHDRAVEMLEQAVGMAPSNLNYRYRLAFAYARADRKEEAMALAQSMLYFSHGPDGIKKAAERLIESLEEQDD